MVAWYWILITVLLTNAITSFTYEYFEWSNLWVDFLSWLALIVLYVPLAIYHICLKNTISPVAPAQFEKIQTNWEAEGRCKLHYLFKGIYFCTDFKASKLWNKIFFLRVK